MKCNNFNYIKNHLIITIVDFIINFLLIIIIYDFQFIIKNLN